MKVLHETLKLMLVCSTRAVTSAAGHVRSSPNHVGCQLNRLDNSKPDNAHRSAAANLLSKQPPSLSTTNDARPAGMLNCFKLKGNQTRVLYSNKTTLGHFPPLNH